MKTLIVEDDFTARKLMLAYLKDFGECDVAVNGLEAIQVFKASLHDEMPYDLVCLDINMPVKDGQQTLADIRRIETEHGIDLSSERSVKVIMTTAMGDKDNILKAFRGGCESYLVKPVSQKDLYDEMAKLGLYDGASR